MRLATVYDGVAAVDDIVARALGVREIAQAARIETRVRALLWAEWLAHARVAIGAASARLRAGKGPARDRDVDAATARVDRVMRRWGPTVIRRFLEEMERVYRLSREAAWRKGTGQTRGSLAYNTKPFSAVRKQGAPEVAPSFDAVDRGAVTALRRNQLFWIGNHYDDNIADSIRTTVRTTIIEEGRDRTAAAKALESRLAAQLRRVDMPSGWRGTGRQYFEALTANAATTARVQGSLRSFSRLGFETYQIVAVGDDRTCEVCAHMDGKEFRTGDGEALTGREVAARAPDAVRLIHPWIGFKRMTAISPTAGRAGGPRGRETMGLHEAGFSLPPFHFRCRCTVDVV